jgi:hypothetical protein
VTRLLRLTLLILLLSPATLLAQESDWREQATASFAILYIPGSEDQATYYAGVADQIFDEVTGTFGHRPATPITLRLYPDLERYYLANPRARGMSGIVAHADFRRNEVVVILPQTEAQSDEERLNNVRHELTHIIASDLSKNRLNAGFQEGLAQYMERPTAERDRKIELLRTMVSEGRLMPWSAFDDRDLVYRNPDLSYPQSLSIVTFLSQRESFTSVIDFLTISATSSGYRSALERAFNTTPDQLEAEWLAWLPTFLTGSAPTTPATSGYDLARAEALLREGSYSAALSELEAAAAGLRAAGQADQALRADQLITISRAGVDADQLARSAYEALVATDYAGAADLVAQARAIYDQIGDTRQEPILAEYAARATRGAQASQRLTEATSLTESFRYPQARTLIDLAAAEYTALGDRERAARALELRAFLDQRQTLLGGVLLLIGVGGVAISLFRRITVPEPEPW